MKLLLLPISILVFSCNSYVNIPKEEKFEQLCSCLNKAYDLENFDKFKDECKSCYDKIEWRNEEESDESNYFMFKHCPKSFFRKIETNLFIEFNLSPEMFKKASDSLCISFMNGKWVSLGAPSNVYTEQIGDKILTYVDNIVVLESEMTKNNDCSGSIKIIKNWDKEPVKQYRTGMTYNIEIIGVYDSLILTKAYFGKFSMLNISYRSEE